MAASWIRCLCPPSLLNQVWLKSNYIFGNLKIYIRIGEAPPFTLGIKKAYKPVMLDWIHHPHTNYVIASYLLAAVVFTALAGFSWCAYKRRSREWAQLSEEQGEETR